MADVFQFPNRVTCFQCAHYALVILPEGDQGYCLLFDEKIDSEIYAARNCGGFEPPQ